MNCISEENLLVHLEAGQKFYSKIDLNNAYLQIKGDNESQKYLVNNTHLGLYKYKRFNFGIHCALAIFQKHMA